MKKRRRSHDLPIEEAAHDIATRGHEALNWLGLPAQD
jgi:hypothetical protein